MIECANKQYSHRFLTLPLHGEIPSELRTWLTFILEDIYDFEPSFSFLFATE